MGLSNSWIAVRDLGRADAIAQLGAEVGGEIPPGALPNFGIGETADGWLILALAGGWAFDDRFLALAKGRTAVACFEEERAMYSEARGFENGMETWRAVHDCNRGDRHLEVNGAPPAALAGIEAELGREQDEDPNTDLFFDIPPRLAKSVCGYRLADATVPEVTFTDLRDPRPARKPGLLARLFGAR